jgi:hypothetical protein
LLLQFPSGPALASPVHHYRRILLCLCLRRRPNDSKRASSSTATGALPGVASCVMSCTCAPVGGFIQLFSQNFRSLPAGRGSRACSWGDLETCPPVPVLKKKNNPTKSSIKSQPAASASVLLYPTAASSNFVFLSARQTVTDASVERAPQFGHGN